MLLSLFFFVVVVVVVFGGGESIETFLFFVGRVSFVWRLVTLPCNAMACRYGPSVT